MEAEVLAKKTRQERFSDIAKETKLSWDLTSKTVRALTLLGEKAKNKRDIALFKALAYALLAESGEIGKK